MNRGGNQSSTATNRNGNNGMNRPDFNVAYHRLLTAPVTGLCIFQNGNLSFANRQFAQILGYDDTQPLLAPAYFLEQIHPDDRSRLEAWMSENQDPLEKIDISFRIKKKNGHTIQANLSGRVTTHNGAPAWIGCLTDLSTIDALKSYRDKYATILNEVEDAVAEVDLKGSLTFYNDAACRMWKVSKTEWIGKNYREFQDEAWTKVTREAYGRVYRTGNHAENIIYQVTRNDGVRIFVEDTISAVRDRLGAVTGFRVVSRDITGRKAAEKQMAEHRVHLEAVFRSVKDAVITVDPQMRVMELSASAGKICHIAAQTVKGAHFGDTLPHCTGACVEVLRQTVETQKELRAFQVDCGLVCHRPQMVSVSCAPLRDDRDKYMGAVMVIRDITLLRDLEKQLGQNDRYLNIIGKSKCMQDIYQLMEDLTNLDTTVLVTGESGTGKELVARALHQTGHRAFKPFVAVNCSALAEGVLESELFGHVRGAFTGAVNDKEGRFEAAHGGTILLDEIGDMSPLIQLKLLRVLQEREFERVGETIPRQVDVRIIGCTNKNLKQKVNNGSFRQDLYYRLKVVEIHLPPLRQRKEDIPLLVDHFCRKYNKKFHKEISGVSSEVIARFMEYPWPGNIRELKHVMESAFILCDEDRVAMKHLPVEIRDHITLDALDGSDKASEMEDERRNILEALKAAHWNKSKAAKNLGFSRQTLYKKLNTYGIVTDADFRI